MHRRLAADLIRTQNIGMCEAPRKIFDLMDTETEPTDAQLAELMEYVAEAVRARHVEARKETSSRAQGASRQDEV